MAFITSYPYTRPYQPEKKERIITAKVFIGCTHFVAHNGEELGL